jgi:hypothetical protein
VGFGVYRRPRGKFNCFSEYGVIGRDRGATADMHTCPLVTGVVPYVGGVVAMGSVTVLIGSMPAARQGDMIIESGPPNTITMVEPILEVERILDKAFQQCLTLCEGMQDELEHKLGGRLELYQIERSQLEAIVLRATRPLFGEMARTMLKVLQVLQSNDFDMPLFCLTNGGSSV